MKRRDPPSPSSDKEKDAKKAKVEEEEVKVEEEEVKKEDDDEVMDVEASDEVCFFWSPLPIICYVSL